MIEFLVTRLVACFCLSLPSLPYRFVRGRQSSMGWAVVVQNKWKSLLVRIRQRSFMISLIDLNVYINRRVEGSLMSTTRRRDANDHIHLKWQAFPYFNNIFILQNKGRLKSIRTLGKCCLKTINISIKLPWCR